jgi:hypothetical protein
MRPAGTLAFDRACEAPGEGASVCLAGGGYAAIPRSLSAFAVQQSSTGNLKTRESSSTAVSLSGAGNP